MLSLWLDLGRSVGIERGGLTASTGFARILAAIYTFHGLRSVLGIVPCHTPLRSRIVRSSARTGGEGGPRDEGIRRSLGGTSTRHD